MIKSKASSVLSFLVKGFKTILSAIIVTLIIGVIYYSISYYVIFPEIEIKINKMGVVNDTLFSYGIRIRNSSSIDIKGFEFVFRFDDDHSIRHWRYDNINRKTDVVLITQEDQYFRGSNTGKRYYPFLMCGLRGYTNQFISEAIFTIEVIIDKNYSGEKGDLFPSSMVPTLHPNSYYFVYNYSPIGFLSFLPITKKFYFTFDGKPTIANNHRTYIQKFYFKDGREQKLLIEF